jgi:hypothetical protein
MNAPVRHEMAIMNRTGHSKQAWDPSNADEVAVAREVFTRMTREGYRAFRPGAGGEPGVRMDTFDPSASAMILVAQLRGG